MRRRSGPLLGIACLLAIAGCAVFTPPPKPTTLEARLAAFPRGSFPVDHPVQIYWSAHQVPFIVAESDGDAAFALGLVHAHLRLGQMEAMRRISQGRLSEMAGPLAIDIDRALRTLDLGAASGEIETALPAETRAWLQRFVDGVNHSLATLEREPHEFTVLGLEREPWTVRDLMTIGRLAAVDVNWLVWFQVWRMRDHESWPELWEALAEVGGASMPSFADDGSEVSRLAAILNSVGKSGSNSFAIAPDKTDGGHAIIANDPHLGFLLPNLWLVAGLKSPSYHTVGFMVPGLPFVAVGRNAHIAWGGTNMRAASSDLFDVAAVPRAEVDERTETIKVRWWFDGDATVRRSPHGPVISDIPMLDGAPDEAIALRWIGHMASDEVSAMLAVNRARNWDEFRDAFRTFAVSAQNMLYADTGGNIGQVMAVQVPARPNHRVPVFVNDPNEGARAWSRIVNASEFPASFNPAKGYLVSANNRPAETEIPVGYFFSSDDRVSRITELLARPPALTLDDVFAIQTDVYQPSSVAIRDAALDAVARLGLASRLDRHQRRVLEAMREWSGHYRIDDAGPIAYEAFLSHFLRIFYGARLPEAALSSFISIAHLGVFVPRDIAESAPEPLAAALSQALSAAAPTLDKFATWGEMHRLELNHPLSNMPLIGARYRFADLPAAGSRQTVMKTNAAPSADRQRAGYGSQARHVSDMSDPDANFFVLLGGQDGWLGSDTFLDQVPLWQEGDYMRVPLRLESIRRDFPHVITLQPR